MVQHSILFLSRIVLQTYVLMRYHVSMERHYICIDLKSFYASVECAERGLDPMATNLVVADPDRSDKTICLAVSPSMKALGVRNRCRVFEIPKSIKYIMAVPRMQKYIDYSAEIYGIYLRYIAPEDIHVYSIDESFIDVTPYLHKYNKTPKEMAEWFMGLIWDEVGIRATAGVGTNLYVTKIALDIISKHAPDFIGVLDENSYREKLWDHQPLTDFWKIGPGTARTLAQLGVYTMRQIAMFDEDVLYRKFGVDAELLIDHAWGRESCTMADIKAYTPQTKSISQGQVLMRDYSFEEGRVVIREMTEQLALDLVDKGLLTESVTIYAGYSNALNVRHAGGTAKLPVPTNSASMLADAVLEVYDSIMNRNYPVRRFFVYCNNVTPDTGEQQMSLFDGLTAGDVTEKNNMSPESIRDTDRKIQSAMVDIKKKFGKNAIFKSADLQECATQLDRNMQIGGHKSGKKE